MTYYVPGLGEKDSDKIIRSLMQAHEKTATNETDIAALQGADYVNSFNTRTGSVVPAQGDYPTSLIPGTTTNDSATAGNIGEYVETAVLSASAVSLTNATDANIATISLPSGDWDVTGMVVYKPAATTNYTFTWHSISTASATNDSTTPSAFNIYRFPTGNVPASDFCTAGVGPVRKSLSGTTTIYLVARVAFTVDTMAAYGHLRARRVR